MGPCPWPVSIPFLTSSRPRFPPHRCVCLLALKCRQSLTPCFALAVPSACSALPSDSFPPSGRFSNAPFSVSPPRPPYLDQTPHHCLSPQSALFFPITLIDSKCYVYLYSFTVSSVRVGPGLSWSPFCPQLPASTGLGRE